MAIENRSEMEIISENEILKNDLKLLTEKFENCNEEIKSLLRKTIKLLEEKIKRLENELQMLNSKTLEELDTITLF